MEKRENAEKLREAERYVLLLKRAAALLIEAKEHFGGEVKRCAESVQKIYESEREDCLTRLREAGEYPRYEI